MNRTAISQDALEKFRLAASQFAHTKKPRVSRLLALKDEIASLRKRGVSCRAISELLTQSGISATDTCVRNFCRKVLNERRRKQHQTRLAAEHGTSNANSKAVLGTPTPVALPLTAPAPPPVPANLPPKRGPRIAKIELVNADSKI